LMMVDPHVHFHVLPRYAEARTFEGIEYPDKGWPGLPDLASHQPATDALVGALRDTWRLAADQEGRS
jgi:diadenosine tetraphosphate (Ap4A) HIT family hydrolase